MKTRLRAATRAGLPRECVPHGLRKAMMRRLAESGASTKELQSVSGHRTLGESAAIHRQGGTAWHGAESYWEVDGEMNDIVERLKTDAKGWDVASNTFTGPWVAQLEREAADEIERLRFENWQLKGALGYPVPADIPESTEFKCGLCDARRRAIGRLTEK